MVNTRRKTVSVVICILLFSVFIGFYNVEKVSADDGNTTIYVDDEGDGDYTSIQDAVNNAVNGSTIYVYSGQYNESIVLSKKINLIGIENELDSGDDTGKPIIQWVRYFHPWSMSPQDKKKVLSIFLLKDAKSQVLTFQEKL